MFQCCSEPAAAQMQGSGRLTHQPSAHVTKLQRWWHILSRKYLAVSGLRVSLRVVRKADPMFYHGFYLQTILYTLVSHPQPWTNRRWAVFVVPLRAGGHLWPPSVTRWKPLQGYITDSRRTKTVQRDLQLAQRQEFSVKVFHHKGWMFKALLVGP